MTQNPIITDYTDAYDDLRAAEQDARKYKDDSSERRAASARLKAAGERYWNAAAMLRGHRV